MKKLIFILLITVAQCSLAMTNQQAINEAKAYISDLLKDPDSAKFKNVSARKVEDYESGKIVYGVCGEVNGKNSYGPLCRRASRWWSTAGCRSKS